MMTNRNLYRIVTLVWAETGVSLEYMQGSERHRRTVMARRLVVGLARSTTLCSFPEIGRVFNRRSHSSAVEQHHEHERLVRMDGEYSRTFWKLHRQLREMTTTMVVEAA